MNLILFRRTTMLASTLLACAGLSLSASSQNLTDSFVAYREQIPGSSLFFPMVSIPGGSFLLGSSEEEPGRRSDEGPRHRIEISPFWMGAHEVTYDEFLAYFEDEETSTNSDVDAVTRPTPQYIDLSWGMGKRGGYPVNSMSQRSALMYCRWLYRKTGHFYRLPTEAEWEYACRAGSASAFSFGDDSSQLRNFAWFKDNSQGKYQKVGQKTPNAWGLYDMEGNLAEWTLDQYGAETYSTYQDDQKDPLALPASTYPKTVRGGSYRSEAASLRCAARDHSIPSWNRRDPQVPKSKWWLTDGMDVGFRIVRPLVPPSKDEIEKFFARYLGN